MQTDAHALYEDGLRLFQEDRIEEAEQSLRRAVTNDPALEDAREALGVILDRMGRLDEAIAVTRNLVEINPDHLMAHVNLSVFYNKKGGMIEEAEAEQATARVLGWKEEIKRNKQAGMAGSSTTVGPPPPPDSEELAAKRETFEAVLKIDPDDPLANFSLGKLYLQENRPARARDHLATVVRVQEDYSAAYLPLGQAFEALGEPDAARRAYRVGIDVAGRLGDLKPLQAMEKRLASLEAPETIQQTNESKT